MKRGTPNHPKTFTLAALLDVQQWGAVGVLESVWHFAQSYAQPGDIGRYSDEAIARAIGWTGDAAALVTALVQAAWFDRCRCHRLRIHDWHQHADQTVHRWLKERNQWFVACYDDPSSIPSSDEPAVAVAVAVPCQAVPEPVPRAKARRPPSVTSPSLETEANRAAVDAYNLAFGAKLSHTNGNLKAAARAYAQGYTLEQFRVVFEAVRENATPTASWCLSNNHEFEYLIRPAYRHHRTQETVPGPLDKILNELAAGTKPASSTALARAGPQARAPSTAAEKSEAAARRYLERRQAGGGDG